MASKTSAGLLMWRLDPTASPGAGPPPPEALQVFIAHPGGPLWARKHEGAWSIPKGEPDPTDPDLLTTAVREFAEETGLRPAPPFLPLGSIRQKSGKTVHAWAWLAPPGPARDWPDDQPPPANPVTIEWPPRSGLRVSFPEVDQARYASLDEARRLLNPAQVPLLDRLIDGWRSAAAALSES